MAGRRFVPGARSTALVREPDPRQEQPDPEQADRLADPSIAGRRRKRFGEDDADRDQHGAEAEPAARAEGAELVERVYRREEEEEAERRAAENDAEFCGSDFRREPARQRK